jgi:hypothetical protein
MNKARAVLQAECRSTVTLRDCVAQQLLLGKRANRVTLFASGHDLGASMSNLEMVMLSLVLVWTPGLAFVAYLLMPRSTD